MSRVDIALNPMNYDLKSITSIVRVFLWLYLHFNFWCNVVDLRHMINVIVCWFTPHFINFIIFRMSNSYPNHCILDSIQLGYIPNIKVNDGGRFVDWDFVYSPFKLIFIVEYV